jgi:hypothetical protein
LLIIFWLPFLRGSARLVLPTGRWLRRPTLLELDHVVMGRRACLDIGNAA